jgi:hypothetical protein
LAKLLAERKKHSATKLLRQIPTIGPIRAALLIALMQAPHRFRTKRQLWVYSGLALKTYTSGQYRFVSGQLQRSKGPAIRGLNIDHSHDLPMEPGSRGRYSWLTSADHDLDYLLMSCPQIVLGRYLAVTSFDSGSLVSMKTK